MKEVNEDLTMDTIDVPEPEIEIEGDEPEDVVPEAKLSEQDMVAWAQDWATKQGFVKPEPTIPAITADPRIAQRDKLLLEASESYEPAERAAKFQAAMALSHNLAVEQAKNELRAEIMPTLGQTYLPTVVNSLSTDPLEQKFITSQLSGYDSQTIRGVVDDPKTKELLLRASRDYAAEQRANRLTNESTQSERVTLSNEDRMEIAQFERDTGIKVTADMIKEAKKYS